MPKRRRRLEGVLFDLDGTLSRSSEAGRRALRRLCRELGRPQSLEDRRVIEHLWGASTSAIIDFLFPREALTRAFPRKSFREAREWVAVKWGEYSDSYNPPLFRGAKDTLYRCKQSGLLVAVVTNAEAPRCVKNILRYGLNERYLDFTLCSTHGGLYSIGDLERQGGAPKFLTTPYKKPDRAFVARLATALRARGIAQSRCVMVGDTLTDAITALRISSYFIPICFGPHGQTTSWWKRELRKLGMPRQKVLGAPSSFKDVRELILDFRNGDA